MLGVFVRITLVGAAAVIVLTLIKLLLGALAVGAVVAAVVLGGLVIVNLVRRLRRPAFPVAPRMR